jgi:molybdate transport system substrate-binding protein
MPTFAWEAAMFARRILVSISACVVLALSSQTAARAAELKIFASRAIATVLQKIGPEFEKSTGNKLSVTTGLSSEFVPRINADEAFDIPAVPPPLLESLIKSGKLVADSKTLVLRSGNGVLVRAGALKPDVNTVEAFKQAVLQAKSITYLPVPGVPQLLERLGLKDTVAAKVTIPKSDTSAEMVAKGEVEMAIVAITQGYTVPGVAIAGPLPPEIHFYTTFGGAVSASSHAPEAARALLRFLKSPTAIPVIKEQGMEPI